MYWSIVSKFGSYWVPHVSAAQSAGAVEYANCISAEG